MGTEFCDICGDERVKSALRWFELADGSELCTCSYCETRGTVVVGGVEMDVPEARMDALVPGIGAVYAPVVEDVVSFDADKVERMVESNVGLALAFSTTSGNRELRLREVFEFHILGTDLERYAA